MMEKNMNYNKNGRKNNKGKNRLIYPVMLALLIGFICMAGNLHAKIAGLEAEKASLLSKKEAEEKKKEDLGNTMESVGTDKFVEDNARDIFGFVKSNEKIFYDINR